MSLETTTSNIDTLYLKDHLENARNSQEGGATTLIGILGELAGWLISNPLYIVIGVIFYFVFMADNGKTLGTATKNAVSTTSSAVSTTSSAVNKVATKQANKEAKQEAKQAAKQAANKSALDLFNFKDLF